ncbi:MAG: ABC transporter permease subunit [Caldilineae bacterium]|nr:ABC transporter permease subunit [Anaerolineae bacterium]MCB0205913.1 ABC transporter permease subunit [Anaerolineae bacterium]MCB9153442.1 ABC transporter permease subunit [Caldilineae bacterium]
MSVFAVARLTFLEARRRRLLQLVLVMGIAFVALFAVGYFLIHKESRMSVVGERLEMSNILLLMGLYAANFLGVVLAVVMSVDVIAGDIASGAIQTLVTKPLRRWHVVVGKWLGLAALLSIIMTLVSASLVLVAWIISRYLPDNLPEGIALMVLAQLLVLTVSILGGTFLNTLANGIFVFMLYGLVFIGGWIEQIAAFAGNQAATNIGILISFVLPSEAIWRRASYLIQPLYLRQLNVGPFVTLSTPSPATVVYSLFYIAVVLAMAVVVFQRRDL